MKARKRVRDAEAGVALILVMLSILVLTTLAAAMVFSARAETFASYNFRISAQAEYVARAGLQKAVNFFNSSLYSPVSPALTTTTSPYNVSVYATKPVNLYYSTGTPATCNTAVSTNGCSGTVTLGTTTSNSNYPGIPLLANTALTTGVAASWVSNLVSQSISDGTGGTGTFTVTATLLDYHTVNNALYGSASSTCTTDTSTNASMGICRAPFEVWQVTSVGQWDSNVGGGGNPATVQIVATISPQYISYFGNALYGLCSVTLNGGTCTDSYNSAAGTYGGSVNSCASPTSGTSQNAAATNAGVGANGGLILNGNNSVGGNATFANSPPGSCSTTGFTGNQSQVQGSVLPGPAIPVPNIPPIVGTLPTGSNPPGKVTPPNASGGANAVANIYLNQTPPLPPPGFVLVSGGQTCATALLGSPGATAFVEVFQQKWTSGVNQYTDYNCFAVGGAGSNTSPYMLGDVMAGSGSGSNPGTINFIAPSTNDLSNPLMVEMNSLTTSNNGSIYTSFAAPTYPAGSQYSPVPPAVTAANDPAMIFNVAGNLSLSGGQSYLNYNPATPGIPSPDNLMIDVHGTSVTMSGQSDLGATVIAPYASASIGGAGANGALFGSIVAASVTASGGYPIHYDLSAKTESGQLYPPGVVSVTWPRY